MNYMENNSLSKDHTPKSILFLLFVLTCMGCSHMSYKTNESINWQDSLYTKYGWDTLKNVFLSQGVISESERIFIDNYLLPTGFYTSEITYETLFLRARQMESNSFRMDCDSIEISFPYGLGETPVLGDLVKFLSGPEIIIPRGYPDENYYKKKFEKLKKDYKRKEFSYKYIPEYDFIDIIDHDGSMTFQKKGDDMYIQIDYKTYGDSIYKMSVHYDTDLATLLKIKYGEPQVSDSTSTRFYDKIYMYGWNFKNIFLCCTYYPSEPTYTENTDYSKFFMTGKLSDIKTTHHSGMSIPRTRISYTNKDVKQRAIMYGRKHADYMARRNADEQKEAQIKFEKEQQQHIQDSINHSKALMNEL